MAPHIWCDLWYRAWMDHLGFRSRPRLEESRSPLISLFFVILFFNSEHSMWRRRLWSNQRPGWGALIRGRRLRPGRKRFIRGQNVAEEFLSVWWMFGEPSHRNKDVFPPIRTLITEMLQRASTGKSDYSDGKMWEFLRSSLTGMLFSIVFSHRRNVCSADTFTAFLPNYQEMFFTNFQLIFAPCFSICRSRCWVTFPSVESGNKSVPPHTWDHKVLVVNNRHSFY